MTSYSIRLCHNDHMLNIISDGSVKLKLYTDSQKTSKGFRLEYKNTCKYSVNLVLYLKLLKSLTFLKPYINLFV